MSETLPMPEEGFYAVYEGQSCSGLGRLQKRGNGFVVGKGLVMTAAHLMPDDGAARALTAGSCPEPVFSLRKGDLCLDAEVVVFDKRRDVLVLKAPVKESAMTIAAAAAEPFEVAAKYGYVFAPDMKYSFTMKRSFVLATSDRACQEGRHDARFRMPGVFPQGTSGSAVFDRKGYVLGMLVRTERNSARPWAGMVGAPSLREVLDAAYECRSPPCSLDPCR